MNGPSSSPSTRRNFLGTVSLASLASVLQTFQAKAGTTILPEPIGVGNGSIGAVPEALAESIDFGPFMVATDPSRPLECIDGRQPVDVDAPVGPKLAGGVVSVHSAFAMCGTPLSDAQALALFGPNGPLKDRTPGGHIDTDHSKDGKGVDLNPQTQGTGCGASDKQKAILHNFVTQSDKITPIVQTILGDQFDATILAGLLKTTIEDVPHDPRGLAFALSKRQERGSLDVLVTGEDHHDHNHGHHESYVVINTVLNTTLNNTLLQKTHKHVQAFCVDMWILKDISQKLYPNNVVEQKKYLHALVAYQVATYITLANGTQKVAVVS